ncbi:MAG TPA: cytochrome c-type biogenesis protein CcmH [Gaiellaceae bacterium]|nr:cytochrome c-type biogenesis protein CcmH [Gaiellaceae bacterium]
MRAFAVVVAALALAAPALASEQHPTLNELEGEVMCPTCHVTLDMSDSPIAQRMKAFIKQRIAAGDTRSAIEAKLVAQFGQGVLAAPPKKGFGLLAWLLPLVGILGGAAALAFGAWKWSSGREPPVAAAVGPPIEPELERRLDDELRRFDG